MGEWGLIAALAARMPPGPLTSVGIGDDAAVVGAPSGDVVAAVDLLLEGRHFRRDWSSAYDIGVKAAARSLADIAAMGAVNTALLVALAVPGSLPARWPLDLADGLAAEAARAGAGIAGGDTARADSVTLSVTALGDLAGRRPVLRSGARPGDVIAVAGPLGRSAAGLALLSAGVAANTAPDATAPSAAAPDVAAPDVAAPDVAAPDVAAPEAVAALIAAHQRPAPPYEAGPEAAALGATAMIDVSDGLLADLGHIADASRVALDVDTSALVTGEELAAAAAFLRARKPKPEPPGSHRTVPADSPDLMALDWVLTGGEDHSLVATFPASTLLPPRWRVIGRALPPSTAAPAVTVNGEPHAGPPGWQHFR